MALRIGVFAFAVAVQGVDFQPQLRQRRQGKVEVGFVPQVFEGVAGDHLAGVAVDVAVGVAATEGWTHGKGRVVVEGKVGPCGTHGGVVHGVPHLLFGMAYPVDDVAPLPVVEGGLERKGTWAVAHRQLGGKAALAVQVGVGALVDTLVVEVGEGGHAVGAADGGLQTQLRGKTVGSRGRKPIVEAESGIVEPQGNGLGTEAAQGEAVAAKEGGRQAGG